MIEGQRTVAGGVTESTNATTILIGQSSSIGSEAVVQDGARQKRSVTDEILALFREKDLNEILCESVCRKLGASTVQDLRLAQDSDIDDLKGTLDLEPITIRKLKLLVKEVSAAASTLNPVVSHGESARVDSKQQGSAARRCRVFLGYRVASDVDLVEKLYLSLKAEGVDVWWDKKCLPPGQPWEEGFADGLCSSDVFVPVLSKASLAPFAQLTAASACDNVLLEYQLALELHKRGDLRAIYPVLVGELKHLGDEFGDLYGDFFKSGGVPACPDVVVKAVEDKVAEHLERLGKGALSAARTVKATLNALTKFQGVKLLGTRAEATDKVIAEIVKVYRRY
jgi:hypothetical protein